MLHIGIYTGAKQTLLSLKGPRYKQTTRSSELLDDFIRCIATRNEGVETARNAETPHRQTLVGRVVGVRFRFHHILAANRGYRTHHWAEWDVDAPLSFKRD